MTERSVLTVSQLAAQLAAMVEERFPAVWVEGEISNFKVYQSGHAYFTLKDDSAQMRCVLFRNRARRIRFTPGDGLHVLAFGSIEVYAQRGEYSLVIELLEPRGLGALQLAFEQLKERLAGEGLFDAARKRSLPRFPRKIGIVTSPSGAAIRDMLRVIGRRFGEIHIVIAAAKVQGEGAAQEVAQGVRDLNALGDVDVIIVGRGGGSLEDLWAFNDEMLARTIAASKVPVISAVGHEVDFTIADFVADLRAPTPSAAAEIVSQTKEELRRRVTQLEGRMESHIRLRLRTLAHFLAAKVGSRGFAVAEARFRRLSQRVDDLGFRLERLAESRALVTARRRRVDDLGLRLERLAESRALVAARRRHVEVAENALTRSIHARLTRWQQAFARIA